jgi:flagellin FlaB
VYKGVEQSTTNIQMVGNVYGISNLTPQTNISEIKFSVGLAPGAPTIDLTGMKIVFSTPNTEPIILTHASGPNANATALTFTTKVNGQGNNMDAMEANQQMEVDFLVAYVAPNTKMTMEMRPSVGAALPFSKTAPPTITKTNVLY